MANVDEPFSVIPITPNMPTEQLIAAIAQNFQILEKTTFETQLFKDETGTPRIIFGRLPDGTYGLVVSEEGVDVTTVF